MPKPLKPLIPEPQRILLIRPSALGDVCRTVPVLVSLRQRYPYARIDWMVQDSFGAAIAAHPSLSHVIRFPRKQLTLRKLAKPDGLSTLTSLLRSLRIAKYDLVIDCQGLLRSGLLSFATFAPRRLGYSNAAEFGWIGYTDRVRVRRNMHTVDRMLALIEAAGVPANRDMRLYTMPGDRLGIDPRLASAPYAVLAPTSRWPGKRWPADRFATLAEALLADGRLGFIAIVAAANERDQCGPLLELARRDNRIIDLVGQTDVGRLMAVIERSSLVVANDSAALHIAVGFGRPIVGLYGPTRTDLVGPYQHEADVIHGVSSVKSLTHKNAAAGEAAMRTIETAAVITAALDRINVETRPAPIVESVAPIIDLPHLDPDEPTAIAEPVVKPRRRKPAAPVTDTEPKPEARVTKRGSPRPPKAAKIAKTSPSKKTTPTPVPPPPAPEPTAKRTKPAKAAPTKKSNPLARAAKKPSKPSTTKVSKKTPAKKRSTRKNAGT